MLDRQSLEELGEDLLVMAWLAKGMRIAIGSLVA